MLYSASDPGKGGALAIIDGQGQIVLTAPFTTFKDMHGYLKPYEKSSEMFFALEKVSAMPKQGVTSMFSFGMNYGSWNTILDILEIPYILVPPQTWMKEILGSFPKGESKPRALAYIQRRFPQLNVKKSQTGVIDALCIALYARYKHTGLL